MVELLAWLRVIAKLTLFLVLSEILTLLLFLISLMTRVVDVIIVLFIWFVWFVFVSRGIRFRFRLFVLLEFLFVDVDRSIVVVFFIEVVEVLVILVIIIFGYDTSNVSESFLAF